MLRSNPLLLWRNPRAIWSYWIAVVSVAFALIFSRWPALHLQEVPVSLSLCAMMLSASFDVLGPSSLATDLSTLSFDHYGSRG